MNKTVLLVEDERRLREIVSDYFRNEGFEVIEAEDGKQALELFAEHTIDLIMLDIMLPEIDGCHLFVVVFVKNQRYRLLC